MFVASAVAFSAPTSSPEAEVSFQSRWDSSRGSATSSVTATPTYPKHCDLAVVGAGWGGAYLAWRLSVDTKTVDASNVCVFEANGRVGGRIYSVRDLPHFGDLTVDVGGYRFQETQKLPADLVFSALKLETACYDYSCQANCEGTVCHVIKDAYGNNRGYATVIERMLGEVEAAGAGTQVYFGALLTAVNAAPATAGKRATQLVFANGEKVTTSKLILNLPGNAVEGLDPSSVIFSDATAKAAKWIGKVDAFPMTKVYAWYDDAWWSTQLGMMEGYFGEGKTNTSNSTGHHFPMPADYNGTAPLLGRYHDGPQRCRVGNDTAGNPVYSGNKVPYGDCAGALEVYYGYAPPYYAALMPTPLQPLTVATAEDGKDSSKQLISDVHASLMAYHTKVLRKKNIDPRTVPAPKAIVMGNWISDGKYTPGIGSLFRSGAGSYLPAAEQDKIRQAIRAPTSDYDVYLADQDYGYQSGWAVGSLIMAEKILQAELGLAKPAWLNSSWYQDNILGHV